MEKFTLAFSTIAVLVLLLSFNKSAKQIEELENLQEVYLHQIEFLENNLVAIEKENVELKVQRQNPSRLSVEEISLLSRLLYSEANLEPLRGKIAVIEVIFNRMKAQNKTLAQIILADGQFDGVNTKNFGYTSEECLRAIQLYQNGVRELDCESYLWYCNPRISTDREFLDWCENNCQSKVIDNHTFYRE